MAAFFTGGKAKRHDGKLTVENPTQERTRRDRRQRKRGEQHVDYSDDYNCGERNSRRGQCHGYNGRGYEQRSNIYGGRTASPNPDECESECRWSGKWSTGNADRNELS